jgi:hypothetical protein
MEEERKVHWIVDPAKFIGFGSQRWARDEHGVERLFVPVYLSVLTKPVEIAFDSKEEFNAWCEDLIKDIQTLIKTETLPPDRR